MTVLTIKRVYQSVVPDAVRRETARFRNRLTPRSLKDLVVEWRVRLGRPLARVRVPHGRLLVDLRDRAVGRVLYLDGVFERAESGFLRSALQPGMVVYDVGANLGYMTTLAATLVGPEGKVVAFEPDPWNFDLLNRNVALNRLTTVRALQLALGEEPGAARLYHSSTNFGDHRVYAPVDGERPFTCITVDRLDAVCAREALPPPDFIKMDVQGYEAHVLRGMAAVLDGGRPLTVLAEYWPHGLRAAQADPAWLVGRMRRAGFEDFVLAADGQLQPADWPRLESRLRAVEATDKDSAYANVVFRRRG